MGPFDLAFAVSLLQHVRVDVLVVQLLQLLTAGKSKLKVKNIVPICLYIMGGQCVARGQPTLGTGLGKQNFLFLLLKGSQAWWCTPVITEKTGRS
jgi:hypothetical protein